MFISLKTLSNDRIPVTQIQAPKQFLQQSSQQSLVWMVVLPTLQTFQVDGARGQCAPLLCTQPFLQIRVEQMFLQVSVEGVPNYLSAQNTRLLACPGTLMCRPHPTLCVELVWGEVPGTKEEAMVQAPTEKPGMGLTREKPVLQESQGQSSQRQQSSLSPRCQAQLPIQIMELRTQESGQKGQRIITMILVAKAWKDKFLQLVTGKINYGTLIPLSHTKELGVSTGSKMAWSPRC